MISDFARAAISMLMLTRLWMTGFHESAQPLKRYTPYCFCGDLNFLLIGFHRLIFPCGGSLVSVRWNTSLLIWRVDALIVSNSGRLVRSHKRTRQLEVQQDKVHRADPRAARFRVRVALAQRAQGLGRKRTQRSGVLSKEGDCLQPVS